MWKRCKWLSIQTHSHYWYWWWLKLHKKLHYSFLKDFRLGWLGSKGTILTYHWRSPMVYMLVMQRVSKKCCIILSKLNKGLLCISLSTKMELWWIKCIRSWEKQGVHVLIRIGSKFGIQLHSREWLFVLSYINATRESLWNFYFLKNKHLHWNFIERCEIKITLYM
jgi:hypothetical protein